MRKQPTSTGASQGEGGPGQLPRNEGSRGLPLMPRAPGLFRVEGVLPPAGGHWPEARTAALPIALLPLRPSCSHPPLPAIHFPCLPSAHSVLSPQPSCPLKLQPNLRAISATATAVFLLKALPSEVALFRKIS